MASPGPATDSESPSARDLYRLFADRWVIAYDRALAVWSAECRSEDGSQIRLICDFSPEGLAGKLAKAESRP